MTPKKFQQELQDKVRKDLPKFLAFVAEYSPGEDTADAKARWAREMQDRGAETLAQAGLIPGDRIEKTSQVMAAARRSERLIKYMRTATREILTDRHYVDICQRMIRDPKSLTREDIDYAVNKTTSDDRLISGVYREAFTDPAIREAMGIPPNVSADEMLIRFRRAIRERGSLGELMKADELYDVFAIPVVPVFVVAIVLALAYVFAAAYTHAAALVNVAALVSVWVKAFVSVSVAGVNSEPWLGPTEGPAGPLRSAVHNLTARHVWVTFRQGHLRKRVAVPPTRSSVHLGLTEIEAILIGGRMNEAESLLVQEKRLTDGAYVLHNDERQPGEVKLHEEAGGVRLVANEAQLCADGAGSAGWLAPTRANCPSMGTIAAVAPAGFNYAHATEYAGNAGAFYDALRLATALTHRGGPTCQ